MEIIQTTSIKLSDEEKQAIDTIIDAYQTCVINDCFVCDECPLFVNKNKECLGRICDDLRAEVKKHDN